MRLAAAWAIVGAMVMSIASLVIAQAPVVTDRIDVAFIEIDKPQSPTLCRGIAAGPWIVLNWHCLNGLKLGTEGGKRIAVTDGVFRALLPRESLAQNLPAALKVAESAGLDFTLLRSPLESPPAIDPKAISQPKLSIGDPVVIRQNGSVVATCHVRSICGSRISYDTCNQMPVPGWSGSSVWTVGAVPRLIGMHKDRSGATGEWSARLFSVILGRSSALANSDSAFSKEFARNPEHRFQHEASGSAACYNDTGELTVAPFITTGKRTIAGLALIDEHAILTTDLSNGQICSFAWPSAAALHCWDNPDPRADRVNAILPLGGGMVAFAKANDGSAKDNGALQFARLGPRDAMVSDQVDIPAMIGTTYGVYRVGSDVVAIGSLGLCTVSLLSEKRECTLPADRDGAWRVNGVLKLDDNEFVAVGVDHDAGLAFPVCKWFRKSGDSWVITARCARGNAILSVARRLQNAKRELQFKAPVSVGQRLYAFASDGGAYEIKQNALPKSVRITGVAESEGQLEDAIRDAKTIDLRHVAIASSDGTFRIMELIDQPVPSFVAHDIGRPRYTAFDLGIWTTQIVAHNDWALVRTQDGGVYSIRWDRL